MSSSDQTRPVDPFEALSQQLDQALVEKEELAKENNRLKEKEEEYYNQTSEAQQERDDLKKQLSNVESEKAQLGRELSQLAAVHEKAAKENLALKAAEQKFRDAAEVQRNDREHQDLQLKTSDRQLKDLRKELTELRKELKQSQARIDEKATTTDELRAQLDTAQERIVLLEEQVVEGEDAQKMLDEVHRELENSFDNLGERASIDEYLMLVRNSRRNGHRRDVSDASIDFVPLLENGRLRPKRQLSVADELNGFTTDDEDDIHEDSTPHHDPVPSSPESAHGINVDRRRHSMHDEYDLTPRRSSPSGLRIRNMHGRASSSHLPTRPSRLRWTHSGEGVNRLSGSDRLSGYFDPPEEDIASSVHDRRQTSSADLNGNVKLIVDDQKTPVVGQLENDTEINDEHDEENNPDYERSIVDLQSELHIALERNQNLQDQLEAELGKLPSSQAHDEPFLLNHDFRHTKEDREEQEEIKITPIVTMTKGTQTASEVSKPSVNSNRVPWSIALFAAILALYLALALHDERSRAYWANDFGSYAARRNSAPGPWQQALEAYIGFDRTQYG